tara:strand:+ start:3563 stop:3757 length:195 start_codon:yes stop_codon:yes gene_type:complete
MRIPNDIHLPEDISDEAAYEIYELLEELFMAVEERYYHQIRRHLQSYTIGKVLEQGAEDDETEF